MSRFEKICWEMSNIQMKVHGSINIPELSSPISPGFTNDCDTLTSQLTTDDDLTGPFSPTLSVDSGSSTSDVSSPSPKYLLHGGPGFSLGLLDSTSGTTKHLPVPIPSLSPSLSSIDMINFEDFSLSEVLSCAFAGDAQVWVGTESGTLHVFDLTPEPRLSSHVFTKFPDPVSCIATRQPSMVDESLPVVNGSIVREVRTRTEVLVGTSDGNLTILAGEANERGGLRNPLKCPRKVIQLGGFEEGGSLCINSITLVVCSGVETYWCACGASIVIIRRSDWREMVRLDGCAGLPLLSEELSKEIHISQLLVTEFGVWSATSHSSTVVLWDTIDFSTKMKITCHNHCSTQGSLVDDFAKITSLSFTYPFLFVGTRGGHLLSFKISEDLTASPKEQTSAPLLNHRIAAATYCGAGNRPIISIHSTPVLSLPCLSPVPATPVPTMHVLVILGNYESEESHDLSPTTSLPVGGLAQLYELTSSPRPSPLTSPCTSVVNGLSSTTSSPLTFSFTSRRDSLANLAEPGSSLPKLSLVSVNRQTRSYLPLRDSD